MQLLPSLVSGLKAICATFPKRAKGAWRQYRDRRFRSFGVLDVFMQSASFLAHQRALEKGQGRSNGQTLFGIGRIPSDNYIRDRLDQADPVSNVWRRWPSLPCGRRSVGSAAEP